MRRADPATAYARAVARGNVVAGPYVRLAAKRHLADLKRKNLRWKADRALAAIGFFRDMLVLENGDPFELEPWQQFIVGSCFGWYNRDGYRRFRTAYIEAGKGCGKTPLAAGVGLKGMIADDQQAPQVFAAATMREQAKIAFSDAVRMVESSPELAELVEIQVGSLSIPGDHAVFRPVSSEHRGLDGLRVHVGIIDELHEHPTSNVVDKIRAGTKNQRNALIFEITNSGWDRTSVCWQHHELSVKVLEGTVKNDGWFAYVCALDEKDDWQDPKVWSKANPSLGTVLPASYLRELVREAQGMPSKENIVKRLNFCVWTEQAERWLDMPAWDACSSKPVRLEDYAGRACMAGLDGAATQDLFAFVLLFEEEGAYDALARFWIPARTLDAQGSGRSEHDRLLLKQWTQEGWIKATDGDTTDYDVVEADIKDLVERVELKRLSFDRWNVTQMITHLVDALGQERVVAFPQTMATLSAPSKELEKIVRDRKLGHGGNPVLRWMASNVALAFGPNEQVKPDRQKSGEKIDGVIATIMALDGWMRQPKPADQSYTVEALG